MYSWQVGQEGLTRCCWWNAGRSIFKSCFAVKLNNERSKVTVWLNALSVWRYWVRWWNDVVHGQFLVFCNAAGHCLFMGYCCISRDILASKSSVGDDRIRVSCGCSSYWLYQVLDLSLRPVNRLYIILYKAINIYDVLAFSLSHRLFFGLFYDDFSWQKMTKFSGQMHQNTNW